VGTRFDVRAYGSRRINGVRNIRQALASPHPAVRLTIRRGLHESEEFRNSGFEELRI
jgi:hypothetical protein